ncbi:MAG: magnesium transporter, partial [Mariprofundaceae bacterium]|nr:magnesium transporter [Mariprofundaceae bacterium]
MQASVACRAMAKTKNRKQMEFAPQEAMGMAAEHPRALRSRLAKMHASELGKLILACKEDHERITILGGIPEALRGDVLLELPEGMQEDMLASLAPSEIEEVVEHLDSDDATDILQAVDKEIADEVIERLEPEDRREIEPLLEHDEESAGGLMQAELFKVRDDWNVQKILEVLRRFGHEIENLNYVYVVDDDDRLTGVIPLHKLLFCNPDDPASRLLSLDFPQVHAGQDQEDVAHIFEKYDVLALPVVNDDGVLVGRITADDILDVVQEEATEDMYRLAALSDQDDLAEPVGITAWRRGIWLTVNLGTAILASVVIAQFEATIAQIIALAVLMPIVASMGGIAGTQTLTVIVRGIALGRVTFETARRALIKEVMVSVVTGLSFAVVMGLIAAFWFPALGAKLGIVIAAAMMINLLA